MIALGALIAVIAGCSSHKDATVSGQSSKAGDQTSDSSAPPGPEAKIDISYARPDDFMTALSVTKYSGAESLTTADTKSGDASIIRFEGGAVVWQIGAEKSLLSDMPVVGRKEDKPYAVTKVKYGVMPADFVASIPETGPPEPLEPGSYYVFTVSRASGSTSYEAVKVNGDGSLEAYAADPRAGTSYRLCCKVAADFTLGPTPGDTGSGPTP